jgi:hypothetical protein
MIENKISADLSQSRNAYEFCTGNKSKALAFCAARSHIVAVR